MSKILLVEDNEMNRDQSSGPRQLSRWARLLVRQA